MIKTFGFTGVSRRGGAAFMAALVGLALAQVAPAAAQSIFGSKTILGRPAPQAEAPINPQGTATTATESTPLALKLAMLLRKLGMCRFEHVGVKAPGTANSATFLPLNTSSVVFGLGPSPVMTRNVADGSLSPTLIAMGFLSLGGL